MTPQQAKDQLKSFSGQYKDIPMDEGSFSEAAYTTNSIAELISSLARRTADYNDMKAWGLTATQWRSEIALALRAKLADLIEWGFR